MEDQIDDVISDLRYKVSMSQYDTVWLTEVKAKYILDILRTAKSRIVTSRNIIHLSYDLLAESVSKKQQYDYEARAKYIIETSMNFLAKK